MTRSSVRRIVDRLGTFDALVLTALLWFLAKFLRYAFPPLFESLQATYGVSNAEIGWAFTAFMLAYAVMQFPSGIFADRLGSVRVIIVGALVTSLAALILVLAVPFAGLVALMIGLGIGTGVHKTVAVGLLSRTYPERTGRVLGIFDTFGTFGGVLAPIAVVAAAGLPGSRPGWRTLLFVTGLCGIAITAGFGRRVPRRLRERGDNTSMLDDTSPATADGHAGVTGETAGSRSTPNWRAYVSLFADRRFSVFVTVTICFSVTYNGLVAFLPLYLTQEAGLSAATAGVLYSALFVASLVQPVAGELSDRIGTVPVIVATLALATLALVAITTLTGTAGPLVLGIAVVCLGLGAHGFRPVRGAYLMDTLPDSISAGGFGLVRTLLMGAGAVAPGVVGTLSETGGFQLAFWLLAVSIAIAAVLSLGLLVTEDSA